MNTLICQFHPSIHSEQGVDASMMGFGTAVTAIVHRAMGDCTVNILLEKVSYVCLPVCVWVQVCIHVYVHVCMSLGVE